MKTSRCPLCTLGESESKSMHYNDLSNYLLGLINNANNLRDINRIMIDLVNSELQPLINTLSTFIHTMR